MVTDGAARDGDTPGTVGDRLRVARRPRIVGRDAELELFLQALGGADDRSAILFAHGPGGIGKTTLLDTMADEAAQRGVGIVRLDGRDLAPFPESVLEAIAAARGRTGGSGIRELLIIDTYERLVIIDDWIRASLLPSMPSGTLVLIASRHAPSAAWRSDPGWRELMVEIPLRNLPAEAAERYLAAEGIPTDLQHRLVGTTYGHPLALSLVADLWRRGGLRDPDLAIVGAGRDPDVVNVLLRRFVAETTDDLRKRAAAVLALVRETDQATLAAGLDDSDASEPFDWLRGQSFVAAGHAGLYPHDLARDVLEADLRWRDPVAFEAIHLRLFDHFVARARASQGPARQRAVADAMWLGRHNPLVARNWDAAALGLVRADRLRPEDAPQLLAMTERHEGKASRRVVQHWLARQPSNVIVFRGQDPDPLGFVIHLALHEATEADLAVDPGARAMLAYAQHHGPPRPGDDVTAWVFNIDRERYQEIGTPTWTLGTVAHSERLMGVDRPAWEFFVYADPEYWAGPMAFADLRRLPDADHAIGAHRLAVFGRDWRIGGFDGWLRTMAVRMASAVPADTDAGAWAEPPVVVLDEAAFRTAVHQALRDLNRPERLAANPLARSRLVRATPPTAGTEPAAILRSLILEAVEHLAISEKTDRHRQALDRTYVRPSASQERAAEVLDLPFSTYRRYLGRGIDAVTAALWARELAVTD